MPAHLEAIRPRKRVLYNLNDFNRALEQALEDTAKEVIKDFKRTTETWEHQPEFKVLDSAFRVGSRAVSLNVGTDDEIYGYVSRGTPAHDILPRQATVLRFKAGFVPKTKPGRMLSKGGGSSGDDAFTKSVHHPGTKPRKFEELIARRHRERGTLGKNIMKRWGKLTGK